MVRCGSCGEENPLRARFCLACAAPLAGAEGGRESRRIVTVLFADLVGSTALGERLDAEAFRALQARYFAALRSAIERHGGTVEKYIGDAVMAVFGLPTLHEDDALRAVRAAADLAPALEPLNGELDARHGIRLELRIGVHTGEVVAADAADRQAMVAGDTVNTAARLEAAARPGEILLGPLTFELVRDAIAAEALEDLALRGRDEPLKAYRLLAITGTEAHLRRLDTPLVGRLAELATLRAAFDRAVAGPACELVTVLAPAGTGKSRLVREFLASTADRATILHGRCLNYGDGITYWALGEIMRAAAGVEETDDPAAVRAKLDALVGADRDAPRVAGILASVLGIAPEPASADDIAWAVRRTLTLLATERPLVVVVEDIHWAEPALLDLCEAIVDWSQGAPILLLCPARPELLEARPDWGAGRPNAAALHLEPLDHTLASDLIDVLPGGRALPGAVRERILSTAEGNPLFVEEFLAMLVDDGHLRPGADGAWTAAPTVEEVPVPHSISLLLAARLDSLDPADRRVAERASVVGRVFERGAVVELSPEAERGTLGGRLLSLTRRQVIRPDAPGLDGDDAFRFRHVLIRDAAYEALTKAERADLHERFARWLERVVGERLPEFAEIYAYHLAQAVEYRQELGLPGTKGLAKDAAAALLVAARSARNLHAYPSAVRHYRRALALYEPEGGRRSPPHFDDVEILSQAADAAYQAGLIDEACELGRKALARADERGDAVDVSQAHVALAAYTWDQGDLESASNHARLAQELLTEEVPRAIRARVLASTGRFYMLSGRFDDAIPACRDAIMEAGELEDAASAKASAMISLATCIEVAGRLDEADTAFTAARQQAELAGDGYELSRYFNNYCNSLESQGRIAESVTLLREGVSVMASLGLERQHGAALTIGLAAREMWHGRPEDALALIERVLEGGIGGDDRVWALIGRGITQMDMGNMDEARVLFEPARLAAARSHSRTRASLELHEGLLELWCDRPGHAAHRFQAALDLLPTYRHDDRARTSMMLARASADEASNARARVDPLAEEAAIERAERHAAEALGEATVGREGGPTGWGWEGELWMAHVVPELVRAEGRVAPEGWAAVAELAARYQNPWVETYARWRQAQDLVSTGAPQVELERVITRGIEVGFANVPARRELVALAERLGIEVPTPSLP